MSYDDYYISNDNNILTVMNDNILLELSSPGDTRY
jgi:hypothetical protein